jgi:hypothetical protein
LKQLYPRPSATHLNSEDFLDHLPDEDTPAPSTMKFDDGELLLRPFDVDLQCREYFVDFVDDLLLDDFVDRFIGFVVNPSFAFLNAPIRTARACKTCNRRSSGNKLSHQRENGNEI